MTNASYVVRIRLSANCFVVRSPTAKNKQNENRSVNCSRGARICHGVCNSGPYGHQSTKKKLTHRIVVWKEELVVLLTRKSTLIICYCCWWSDWRTRIRPKSHAKLFGCQIVLSTETDKTLPSATSTSTGCVIRFDICIYFQIENCSFTFCCCCCEIVNGVAFAKDQRIQSRALFIRVHYGKFRSLTSLTAT